MRGEMASAEELVKKVEAGAEVEDSKPQEAVATYRDVIFGAGGSDGDSIKAKESAMRQARARRSARSRAAAGF